MCYSVLQCVTCYSVLQVTVCYKLQCVTCYSVLHVTVCYMLQCATCYSVLPTGHSRPVTDNLLASFRDTVQVKPVTAGVHCGRGGITVGRGCLIIGIIVLASCVMCHAVFHSLNCISVFVLM